MAAVAGTTSASATLSGTTADTVTLTGAGKYLAVKNKDAASILEFRTDGTEATAGADGNRQVAVGETVTIGPSKFGGTMSLSIVGNGNAYSVELF